MESASVGQTAVGTSNQNGAAQRPAIASQSAEQQATDEYECHKWAVSQTGFDPTGAAVGQTVAEPARRGDYERARGACLEGRGYTVR